MAAITATVIAGAGLAMGAAQAIKAGKEKKQQTDQHVELRQRCVL